MKLMVTFSAEAEHILQTSGWYAGRKVNILKYIFCLLIAGMRPSIPIRIFLAEFGNLKLIIDRGLSKDYFHFNVCKAVKDIDYKWIKEDYEKRIGGYKICVIGQAFENHLTLMMSSEGKVYGGYDDLLFFIGENGKVAIEALCKTNNFLEIK